MSGYVNPQRRVYSDKEIESSLDTLFTNYKNADSCKQGFKLYREIKKVENLIENFFTAYELLDEDLTNGNITEEVYRGQVEELSANQVDLEDKQVKLKAKIQAWQDEDPQLSEENRVLSQGLADLCDVALDSLAKSVKSTNEFLEKGKTSAQKIKEGGGVPSLSEDIKDAYRKSEKNIGRLFEDQLVSFKEAFSQLPVISKKVQIMEELTWLCSHSPRSGRVSRGSSSGVSELTLAEEDPQSPSTPKVRQIGFDIA